MIKNEHLWHTFCDEGGKERFKITTKVDRPRETDWWYLYDVTDGKEKLLGKAHSPIDLEVNFRIIAKLKGKK